MAPERFSRSDITISSTKGDVYSLAMTSFEVCFCVVSCRTIQCNNPITIRSSRGYCHTVAAIKTRWPLILGTVNDHPAHGTQVGIDGCKTPFGIQSQPVGAPNQNGDMNSLSCTVYFRSTVGGRP